IIEPNCPTDVASQIAEVGHRSVVPKEGIDGGDSGVGIGGVAGERLPGNLSALVDGISLCIRSAQSAQIAFQSVLPEKRAELRCTGPAIIDTYPFKCRRKWVGGCIHCPSHHLPAIVNTSGLALCSAERPQVFDMAVLPDDRMDLGIAGLGINGTGLG